MNKLETSWGEDRTKIVWTTRVGGLVRYVAAVAFIIASTVNVACSASADEKSQPSVKYWQVWTDGRGVSHQTACVMKNFVLQSIEPPASPQWLDRLNADGATVIISLLPPGWIGTWHENPNPQWIVPLSGRWFVQTMDGTRVEMGPGDLSFGGDQLSKPDAQGHKGHLSGSLGSDPAVLMIVQLKDPPTSNDPCHYK
jgi:hypothetical protein